jgi:hypothetical protein
MITSGIFSSGAALYAGIPSISLVRGSNIGTSVLIFPTTGHLTQIQATIYTDRSGSSLVTPVVGVYYQAIGVNGQNTGSFIATGISNQIQPGVIEPNSPAATTTIVPINGSYAVNAGDRYLFVLATNNWGNIRAISIAATVVIP